MDALAWPDWAPASGVLFMSAGVDSLACLLLLRQHWDRLTVLWSNPGAPHPQTTAYMAGIRARVPNFVEVRGQQPAWIRTHGWPADVVPVRATAAGEVGAGPAPLRFQSYMDCCGANMWSPSSDFVTSTGAGLVITGQRGDEALRNRLRDGERSQLGAVTYWNPLQAWSRAQVLEFLAAQAEPLPPFYADGATSSADCWNCTAYLDHGVGRLGHMRRAEPERFAVVSTVLIELARRQRADAAPLQALLATSEGA